MVNLTRIYTRTGDAGTTRLGDMSETSKSDARLATYADVDEANSQIGYALSVGGLDTDVADVLLQVQNDLFDVGADIANPITDAPAFEPLRVLAGVRRPSRGVVATTTTRRSKRCVSFILPGGTPAAALLHVARTVVRRAERSGWHAYTEHAATMNVIALTYLNRLSDLLFILARYANRVDGDVLWKPGGDHQQKTKHGDEGG